MNVKAIVIGLSSGGMDAMKTIFSEIPSDFSIPIIMVQHISPKSDSQWIEILDSKFRVRIKEAEEKERIKGGTVYLAPPNYHLLLEKDGTLSLSIDERVSFARPSIDVLFETAAIAFTTDLVGIILTGSNHDGSAGLKKIKQCGGITIVQNPATSFSSYMPKEAIRQVEPDHIFDLEDIIAFIKNLEYSPK